MDKLYITDTKVKDYGDRIVVDAFMFDGVEAAKDELERKDQAKRAAKQGGQQGRRRGPPGRTGQGAGAAGGRRPPFRQGMGAGAGVARAPIGSMSPGAPLGPGSRSLNLQRPQGAGR